jgi:hypothetical protein
MYMKRSAQLSQLKACYQRVWDHLSSGAMEGALTSTEGPTLNVFRTYYCLFDTPQFDPLSPSKV